MPIREQTLESFTNAVAARTPTPGGGAVAAVAAAQAAALVAMVVEFTLGKSAHAAHEAANSAARDRAIALRDAALQLADRDAAAYAALNALWKLPKESRERTERWDPAVREAIDAPQAVLTLAAEIARLASALQGSTNPSLASDLAIALDLARVAARAAAHNVAVNAPCLTDPRARALAESRMNDTLAAAGATRA